MSSTFLTRLRIGEKLVDAKGVSRLYNPGTGFAPAGPLSRRLRGPAGDRRDRLAGADDLAELIWLKIKIWLGIYFSMSACVHI